MNPVPGGLSAPLASEPTLRERWLQRRNRWLSSPRLQRWAAKFPPTRGIAARRAAALFDLCAGFVYSQLLFACVRLRLFEALADGPRSCDSLARCSQLEPAAMRCLLDAAVSLRLLERRGADAYGLGQLGAAMLGNPGIAAMVEHHEMLYADLADPLALLRGEARSRRLSGYWPYATAGRPETLTTGQVSAYTTLMSQSQPLVAADVLDAYPFEQHRCLLDVGGGDGTFLCAVAERLPGLQLRLFDLPAVIEQARSRLAGRGLASRVSCTGGSFLTDELPRGADVVSLIRVLHDHDDAVVATILRAVRRALPPGGTVVIGEPLAEAAGDGSMRDAYFGLYLYAMGSGRPRSAARLIEMLQAAGFIDVRQMPTARPLLAGVVIGRAGPP
jgi:demethylspheroidene O-methyltransferase